MNDAASQEEYPLISAIMLVGKVPIPDVLAAIACFKAQTYPYKELIIVNNANSQLDASALNIKADRDVFLIDTPLRYSAGMARNYGIAAANGRILAQFDADYWFAPNRLEAQVGTMAQNEAQMVVLASTMQYSFVSGRASYYVNERKAILGTMMFVRPANIDYPNVEKGEELAILERFSRSGHKIISMPTPELACKFHLTTGPRVLKVSNAGLSRPHLKIIRRILKDHEGILKDYGAVGCDQTAVTGSSRSQ